MQRTRGRLRGKWTAVGGRSIFARVTAWDAPAKRPPIVLVHGLGISSSYMVPLAEDLAGDTMVYALDLPGYGRSRAHEILDLGQLGESLGQWIEANKLSGPLLVGNSFGCQVIAEYHRQSPGRAGGLMFIGPTLDSKSRFVPRLLAKWIYEATTRESGMTHLVWRDYLVAGPRRSFATLGMMLADKIETKLEDVRIPVMLARGEHDPIAPHRWLVELQNSIPGAEIATIRGAAHPANFLEPEETAGLVRHFRGRLNSATHPRQED